MTGTLAEAGWGSVPAAIADGAHLATGDRLRRLAAAVLAHQDGRLRDDATLLVLDWSSQAHLRMFPRFD